MAFKNISKLIFIQANPEIKKSHLIRYVFSFGIRETLTMYDYIKKKCLYKASHGKVVYSVVQRMGSGPDLVWNPGS